MKRLKLIILAVIIALTFGLATACGGGGNSEIDCEIGGGQGGNQAITSFNVDFIRYVAADLEGATSIGVLTANQLQAQSRVRTSRGRKLACATRQSS